MKVIVVAGARPNFVKVAPIVEAMKRRESEFAPLLVHTGQHYDAPMSDSFFRELSLPEPDIQLEVGSGSHAAQTARVMERFEPVLLREKPDWVLVVGDVNSSLACALVCAKSGIKVAHVEAGLRSRDRSMPEEINRLVTDQISDLLLTPSYDADANLLMEGIPKSRISRVGNVMIDTLLAKFYQANSSTIREQLGVRENEYAVLTLHRPSNVDDRTSLSNYLEILDRICQRTTVVFPIHPRTRGRLAEFDLIQPAARILNLKLVDPLGYLDFLRLYSGARFVMTDSGGIQEETSVLGIPCLTLRENTERPITIELGTNLLVGCEIDRVVGAASSIMNGPVERKPKSIPLWDGKTADRILDALLGSQVIT